MPKRMKTMPTRNRRSYDPVFRTSSCSSSGSSRLDQSSARIICNCRTLLSLSPLSLISTLFSWQINLYNFLVFIFSRSSEIIRKHKLNLE